MKELKVFFKVFPHHLLTLRGLDISVAEIRPSFWNADIRVNFFNPPMEIDCSAGVLKVVASVVNVDAVVLIGQVSLQLMSGVPVYS